MRFRVVLPKFPFSECLRDLADCLVDGLLKRGHETALWSEFKTLGRGDDGIRFIAVGAHHPSVQLPDCPVIIYQTETPNSRWFTPQYKARLASALAVWEAAPGFVTQEAHRTSVVAPGLMSVPPVDVAKDIDVLFYGSLSDRRIALLKKLQEAGLAPSVHFNVFGAARDALIDRAKLVVDIKQGEHDPNDNTRLFWLDSLRACVLSENDDRPERALVPWKIVEQCKELLASPERRTAHTVSRIAGQAPMDVSAAVAQLEGILREQSRLRAVPAE